MMDIYTPPVQRSSQAFRHYMYIVTGILSCTVLVIMFSVVLCYYKKYRDYKQYLWRRLRYQHKMSISCPDFEALGKNGIRNTQHRLSADDIWEATGLFQQNSHCDNKDDSISLQQDCL